MAIRIGVLTVSDRASRGEYEDRSGPAIIGCLRDVLSCEWEPVARVHGRYFGDIRPACTMLSAGLAQPSMKIEIEVTALKRQAASR